MDAKHTPGPWRVSHDSADPEWSVVVASGGRIVANVNAETGPDIPPMVATQMPKDANANVIAAAPDLLEACKDVAEALRGCDLITHRGGTDSRGNVGQTARSTSAELAVLAAAIAKAEGGE